MRHNELTVEEDCLLWGIHVIVPLKLRHHVLDELHMSHLGMVHMTLLARIHVWCPHIDQDIEAIVRTCNACQLVHAKPPQVPTHPWVWSTAPWKCIHVDFAGPFLGHMFLIVVDTPSKWLEVEIMPSTTAEKTIDQLRYIYFHTTVYLNN